MATIYGGVSFFLLTLSPSCFAVCGHHLSPRIAIVFSLLSSVPNFPMSHQFVYFPHLLVLTHPVRPCTLHIRPISESYSTALPQGHICPSSSSSQLPAIVWYLFLLSGRSRSTTRNRRFQTVSLLGFLLYPSIFFRLRYPTLFQLAFSWLSPIQSYQLWLATFFGLLRTLYCQFNFLTSHICFKWAHSQCCSQYCLTRRT